LHPIPLRSPGAGNKLAVNEKYFNSCLTAPLVSCKFQNRELYNFPS
jgi:hypothetical protein